MDVGEKIFSRISDWFRRRKASELSQFDVELESELAAVYLFSQATPRGALILAGGAMASVSPEVVRLPSHTVQFNNLEINRFLLLHKSLAAGAILDLRLRYPQDADSVWSKALAVYLARKTVQEKITQDFPAYAEWAASGFQEFEQALDSGKLEREDRSWLQLLKKVDLSASTLNGFTEAKSRVAASGTGLLSAITRMPAYALAPWCELMHDLSFAGKANSRKPKSPNESPMTEVNSPGSSQADYVELQDKIKEDSPISHSFEKLETADEYTGGFRAADGSDQMMEQQQALEELRLDKVTRDGESAASQYSTDLSGSFESQETDSEGARHDKNIWLPEWDYRKRTLKERYCRLYTEHASGKGNGEVWLQQLKEKHRDEISAWESKLWSLLNKRRWKDRELDGADFSIDAVIRYFSDIKHGGYSDPRLFTRTVLRERDLAVLILLDQSLSTDSWVANRRILDVELDSVGLIGALMGPLKEPVAIAGTWSETRNHCFFRSYKRFDEPWSVFFDNVSDISPTGYTRLGPAIRHGAALLRSTNASKRLMILLTDGKPTDFDRYEGRYGIEDIHHAFLEAKQIGVSIKALTVESHAKHYFPFMFGASDYHILSDPSELPGQLFRIFLETRNAT